MQKTARAVLIEIGDHAGEHVGVVHRDQRADNPFIGADRRGVEQAALALRQHHAAIVDAGNHRLPRLRALDGRLRILGEVVRAQADVTIAIARDDDAGAFEGKPGHALEIALFQGPRKLRGNVLRLHAFPRPDKRGERFQRLRIGTQHAADGVAVFLDAELHLLQRRRSRHIAQYILQQNAQRHKGDGDRYRERRETVDALPEPFFFHKKTAFRERVPPPPKICARPFMEANGAVSPVDFASAGGKRRREEVHFHYTSQC